MIFYDDVGKPIESPRVIYWEKGGEINTPERLEITILNQDIRKDYRIVHNNVEYIVDESGEYRDEDVLKTITCLSTEIELVNHYISDIRPSGNADAVLMRILEGSRFEVGHVDDLGTGKLFLYHIDVLGAILKLCEEYDCEYYVTIINGQRYINLKKRIGKDLGKRVHYKKDMEKVKRTVHSDNICTKLYVYGKGEESGDGWGRRISIDSVNDGKKYLEDNALRLTHGLGAERLHREQEVIFEDIEEPDLLLARGITEFEKRKVYRVSYETDIVNLGKMGLAHENVELGDTITVIDEAFIPPLAIKARVVKVIESSVTERKLITLGNYRDDFAYMQKRNESNLNRMVERSTVWDAVSNAIETGSINYLEGVLEELNRILSAGEGFARFVPNRGLVVPNKPNEDEATHVVEVGGGFIRIANSRDSNGNWNYTNISDANGVIASSITTGILKGGKVRWNLETGTFLIGDSTEDFHFFYDGEVLRIQNTEIDISNNQEIIELKGGLTSAHSAIQANATEIATKISKTQILTDTEIQEVLKGEKGDKGEDGSDAPEKYTWYRWADTPTSGISENPLNKDYLGIAYNKPTPTPSDTYDDYDWVLVKGERGADGVSPDDKFFWVKYADDDKGTGMSDSPVGKRWLGVAENKDTLIESNDYRDYKWSPLYDNSVIMSATAPANPNIAQLWLDTSVNPNLLKRWTGEKWETISDTTEIQNLISTKADAETVDQQLQNIVNSVNNTIESQIQQTSETFEVRFTDIITAVDEAGNRIDELSDEIETNIRFTADGMEMGKSTNPISMKLMPDRLGFWENGIEIAYFSNDTLFVNNLHAKESVRIGPVAWVLTRDTNGNVTHASLRKVT